MKKIGVLALQGDFHLHSQTLQKLGCETIEIRLPHQLDSVEGLIIPGGESTTTGKLIQQFGFDSKLPDLFHKQKFPIFATCMGVIVLAKRILQSSQFSFGFFDVTIDRNAYGRQVDSFETNITVNLPSGAASICAIFIRAPKIVSVGPSVEVLSSYNDSPVLIREGNCLGATFHPELTDDVRIHKYFLEMI